MLAHELTIRTLRYMYKFLKVDYSLNSSPVSWSHTHTHVVSSVDSVCRDGTDMPYVAIQMDNCAIYTPSKGIMCPCNVMYSNLTGQRKVCICKVTAPRLA